MVNFSIICIFFHKFSSIEEKFKEINYKVLTAELFYYYTPYRWDVAVNIRKNFNPRVHL